MPVGTGRGNPNVEGTGFWRVQVWVWQKYLGVTCVRATSDNMNKQKARENLRNIYVMNEYVHT
jgi:hypothetical protein